jgi:hypothetical protein
MDSGDDEIPLLSTEEAIAEVRRWLEVERVDPERIFTAFGETVIRYRDLIGLLERETADGQLLRFAISRGRVMQRRPRGGSDLLQILPPPPETDPSDS